VANLGPLWAQFGDHLEATLELVCKLAKGQPAERGSQWPVVASPVGRVHRNEARPRRSISNVQRPFLGACWAASLPEAALWGQSQSGRQRLSPAAADSLWPRSVRSAGPLILAGEPAGATALLLRAGTG